MGEGVVHCYDRCISCIPKWHPFLTQRRPLTSIDHVWVVLFFHWWRVVMVSCHLSGSRSLRAEKAKGLVPQGSHSYGAPIWNGWWRKRKRHFFNCKKVTASKSVFGTVSLNFLKFIYDHLCIYLCACLYIYIYIHVLILVYSINSPSSDQASPSLLVFCMYIYIYTSYKL